MTTGYVIPVDPAELANRFSTPSLEDEYLEDEDMEDDPERAGLAALIAE